MHEKIPSSKDVKGTFEKGTFLLRAVARLLDYGFFYLIISIATLLSPFFLPKAAFLLIIFLIPLLFVPLEALQISLFKTTFGKFFLGIFVTEENGDKLSFKKSLKRAFLVLVKGMVFGLSPFSFIGMFRFAKSLKHKQVSSWDAKLSTKVSSKRTKGVNVFLSILLSLMLISPFVFWEKLNMPFASQENSYSSYLGFSKEKSEIQWKKFQAPSGNFTVAFPKKPTTEEKDLAIPNSKNTLPYKEFKCEHVDDVFFSVSYTVLPNKWVKWSSRLVLKGSLKLLCKHLNKNKIVWKEVRKHKKFPALNFQLTNGKNDTLGKLILVGNTLYKVEVVYPAEKKEDVLTYLDTFLNSFNPK